MRPDTAARRADTLFNDAWLPDETKGIRREARDFAEAVLRPAAFELNTTVESREAFPEAAFAAMATAGLYAVPFAADVGGRGLKYPTLATLVVLEELAYFTPGLASALFDGQAILVGRTLDNAPAHLRLRWLPALIRGEFVGAFATSEPETSTDLSPERMLTVATPVDGGWRIDGRKRWITNACRADLVTVLCRTGDRQSMFLVDMKSPGVGVTAPDRKMGNHAQLTSDVIFDGVFVPRDHLIGREDGGLGVALAALALGRMGIGAIGVGMAQAAFDHAADHMCRRHVFGKPLASMQHWQYVFADHAVGLEQARSLYMKAGWRQDVHGGAEVEGAMAKLSGSRLAVEVARDAIQVCGAYGFARELAGSGQRLPLESIYRDAKIGEIYEGANEIQKWVIARNIFGRHFTA